MKEHLFLPLVGALIFGKTVKCIETCMPNIAIIGGGIGGASASHFLTELFANNLTVDLYEGNNIGGRLATIKLGDKEYESGGSIIHSRNKYMQNFVKLLGMEHRPSSNHRFGIWNGDMFVFRDSEWQIVTMTKLLYRYGVQPFKLSRYVNSILDDFEKIYDLQDTGKSFENITALLKAMNKDFPALLQVSIKNQLLNLGYEEMLIDELVKATLVVNYGQDTNVHSFVGAVSLAGAGYNLWAVKGGNKEVPEHLIYRNGRVTVVPSYVTKICNINTGENKNLYEVHYHNKGSKDIMKSTYDIIILAIPLTADQEHSIEFEGFPSDLRTRGDYRTTVATFVKGDLNAQYFDVEEGLDVLSCNPNKTIFRSIGELNSVEGTREKNQNNVWKIFSSKSLEYKIIHKIFTNVKEIKEVTWKAYPKYATSIRTDKFKLHNAMYYINAIEWVASAMEMSAIGGRNVAILAHRDFSKKCMSNNERKTIPQNFHSTEL